MTREQAVEIRDLLREQRLEIDKHGTISNGNVWTTTIQDILKRDGLIFFDSERTMVISNWPKDLDRCENRVVRFKGFDGEDMEIRVIGEEADHDNVEIWKDGKEIAMMHIEEKVMFIWPRKAQRKSVKLV